MIDNHSRHFFYSLAFLYTHKRLYYAISPGH
nr:MAG TPA: hypothetical protein [Caudoviricetes sp.]